MHVFVGKGGDWWGEGGEESGGRCGSVLQRRRLEHGLIR